MSEVENVETIRAEARARQREEQENAAIAEAQEERTKYRASNTTRQYNWRQAEYEVWCRSVGYPETNATEPRLLVFLRTRVVGRKRRTASKKNTEEALVVVQANAMDEATTENASENVPVGAQEDSEDEDIAIEDDEEEEATEGSDSTAVGDENAPVPTNAPEVTEGTAAVNDNAGTTISLQSIKMYVAAVVDLWKQQKEIKTNSGPNPRGSLIKGMLRTLAAKETERKRVENADRGTGTMEDRVQASEYERIATYFLDQMSEVGLRHRADHLLARNLVSRGELQRMLQFPDLGVEELPNEGIQGTMAFRASFRQSKTNQYGKVEHAGCLRNRHVHLCPINGIALYLFWRFHVTGEVAPDMTERENWYSTYLLKTSSPTTPMGYDTQYKAIKKCFKKLNIQSAAKTHLGRGIGGRDSDYGGASDAQTRRQGRWNDGAMSGCYLNSALPLQSLRSLAGFNATGGDYHLPRATLVPSQELQQLVFPFVEQLEEQIANLNRTEISGSGFIRLLKFLRVVLLQDAATMINSRTCSSHPLWKNELFTNPDFLAFADDHRASTSASESPVEVLLRRALPELTARVDHWNRSSYDHVEAVAATLHRKIGTLSEEIGVATSDIGQVKRGLADFSEGRVAFQVMEGVSRMMRVAADAVSSDTCSPTGFIRPRAPIIPSQSIPLPEQVENVAFAEAETLSLETAPQDEPNLPVPPSTVDVAIGYRMSRGLKTVGDVWREYAIGLGGAPSVRALEARHARKWRKANADTKFFFRRKAIYDKIDSLIVEGLTEANAVAQLETERAASNLVVRVDLYNPLTDDKPYVTIGQFVVRNAPPRKNPYRCTRHVCS